MNVNILIQVVESLLVNISIYYKYAITLIILAGTVLFVDTSYILTKNYIQFDTDAKLVFDETFKYCELSFRDNVYLTSYNIAKISEGEHIVNYNDFMNKGNAVNRKRYQMIGGKFMGEDGNMKIKIRSNDRSEKKLDINDIVKYINIEAQEDVIDGISHNYECWLFKKNNFPGKIEIVEAKINGKKVSLDDFFEKHIHMSYGARNIENNYIRDIISNFLLRFNDPISNYILTALFLFTIYLSVQFSYMFAQLHFPDKIYKKYMQHKFNINNKPKRGEIEYAKDMNNNDFALLYRRYQFLEVIGPAFGFVLTVSSLIAGLQPEVQTTQDMSYFFQCIQVAMISTFIGLSIRILAIWSNNINMKIFERNDIFFDDLINIHTNT